MNNILEIKNLKKTFGNLDVLRGISLSVKEKEVFVLCGISGSGKSTLIRCINHLEIPDSGKIIVKGNEITQSNAREMRKNIGMVFQSFNLFPHLTAMENCTISLTKVLGIKKDEAEDIAFKYFKKVGLPDKIKSYPHQLSGGQKQRVAIVRALSMEPDLLLFDEPTSALDPEMISDVLDVMRNIALEGMTMIIVTHEMGFAKEVADMVAMLHNGKIIELKPPKLFFSNPEHKKTKSFLKQILNP